MDTPIVAADDGEVLKADRNQDGQVRDPLDFLNEAALKPAVW
jgi:hypothetical protein